MKKSIMVAGLATVLILGWRMGAMQQAGAPNQDVIRLRAKVNASDAEPTQEFELEKDHALLSGVINGLYEALKDEEGNYRETIPLNISVGEINHLLKGNDYDYILDVHRANDGADANPAVIRGLAFEERIRKAKLQAETLNPATYSFTPQALQEAWNHLKAAHYLEIPELVQKYASIIEIMLCSDASLRLLKANNQAHVKVVSEITEPSVFSYAIKQYIPVGDWILMHTLEGHTNIVTSASFSPDGNTIVSTSPDGTAKIWNVTGRCERTLMAVGTESVLSASFSPDGSKIVTASSDNTARIWDVSTGGVIRTLAGHTSAVWSASFSPDGSTVVTASRDNTAKIWNADTGVCEHTLRDHINAVRSASFSPDGSKIVTASWDETAKIWNVSTGGVIRTLAGHTAAVYSASFSPDGSKIVTAAGDDTAKIWNVSTGTCERTLMDGHIVYSASFSPDGNKIVTAFSDGMSKIWTVSTGRVIGAFASHTAAVYSASFSPDGSKIVTASEDKTAKIWALLPAHNLEQAIFMQYLKLTKKRGVQGGWESEWGRSAMDTYNASDRALIEKAFPQIRSGSSSSSSSSSNNNNNNNN